MLKNKRILITAGPTWVAIDKVRVLSNISTGQTGFLIAEQALKEGAKVTLLLGPTINLSIGEPLKVIRFSFFDELMSLVQNELKRGKYDVVIHAAAVSDYKLQNRINTKLKSGLKNLKLDLVPTPKLINKIKQINPKVFLVGFKLETASDKNRLIKSADNIFKKAKADLVVANSIVGAHYSGLILDRQKNILARATSRREMAIKLIKLLKEKL